MQSVVSEYCLKAIFSRTVIKLFCDFEPPMIRLGRLSYFFDLPQSKGQFVNDKTTA